MMKNLNPCEFSIRIRGMEVFRAGVCPEYLMFYADEIHTEHKIKKIQLMQLIQSQTEKLFGLKKIKQKTSAKRYHTVRIYSKSS